MSVETRCQLKKGGRVCCGGFTKAHIHSVLCGEAAGDRLSAVFPVKDATVGSFKLSFVLVISHKHLMTLLLPQPPTPFKKCLITVPPLTFTNIPKSQSHSTVRIIRAATEDHLQSRSSHSSTIDHADLNIHLSRKQTRSNQTSLSSFMGVFTVLLIALERG